ncbi:hypothetical protein ON010_g11237 [Phytophthora cinnamomi]|nr:hypothetical protein ON010_g11237 [Phytophthora cinnamomi]
MTSICWSLVLAAAAPSARWRPQSDGEHCDSGERSVGAQWPSVTGCEGVRKALTFLQTSRQHALMLMLQNHWERAMTVLEKIEKATESVSEQRRQVVIQQANAGRNVLVEKIQELELAAPRRAVRFSDDVAVAVAEDMDRKGDAVSEPVREEMLVLRASRKIPQENLSEFWNE